MSDAVKWALLVAGAVILIALIMALPFTEFINFDEFASGLTAIVEIAGDAFQSARGLINSFLTPFGRGLLTGIMLYLFGKWAVTISLKIVAWIYHFIFK